MKTFDNNTSLQGFKDLIPKKKKRLTNKNPGSPF